MYDQKGCQTSKKGQQMVNCIVIDDERDIVDLICEFLDIIKVDVMAKGNNGKDAVELYKKHTPDIVFTDLSMPDYDGLYAIENIKDENLNAKIIVVTGNPYDENKYFFDLLRIPIISKPFDMNILKQVVEEISSTDTAPTMPFEIKYKFKEDHDFYTCVVNYEQYRNFKKLPIIHECEIVKNNEKNIKLKKEEMEKALNLAVKNDSSHIRKLSKISTDGGMRY